MMHEVEEKSLTRIQEWHQQTIAMVEILHVASETENHFQMLGMGQKSSPTHNFATHAMSKSNNYFIFLYFVRNYLLRIMDFSHIKIDFIEYAKTNNAKDSIFKGSNPSLG